MAGQTRRPGELPPLPKANPDPLIGTVIGDRYRLVERIGAGGMATVYRAEHLLLKKPVAVKLLLPELVGEGEMTARFEREAIAAARLDHPNCVSVIDFGKTAEGRLFLVMEFLEGTPLDDLIEAAERMPWERAVELARQMLRGLAHAHEMGIVHRDLKPSNIMVTAHTGGREVAKIIDFGIAKIVSGSPVGPRVETQAGVVFGTADFLSPERLVGKGDTDPRSDLYSIGIILYEMLTGERPFHDDDPYVVVRRALAETAPPPSGRVAGIPVELDAVVARALEKDPEQRFASARDMLAALDPLARKSTGGIVAPVPAPSYASLGASSAAGDSVGLSPLPLFTARPARRRRWPLLAAAAAAVALVIGAYAIADRGPQAIVPGLRAAPAPTATDPEKDLAVLVQSAAEGSSVADRQAAFDRLVALGYGDRVPWVPMLGRDLAQLPTCEERREVVSKLRKLKDPKALPFLEEAAQRPDNGCLVEEAQRAAAGLGGAAATEPAAAKKRPPARSGGGGGHF